MPERDADDWTALYASLNPGHEYSGYIWPGGSDLSDGFALTWTDAETARTGRLPSDLFVLLADLMDHRIKIQTGGGIWRALPSAAYLLAGADSAALDAGLGALFDRPEES